MTLAKEKLIFFPEQISAAGAEVSPGSFHVVGRAALGREPGRDKRRGGATTVETSAQRCAAQLGQKLTYHKPQSLLIYFPSFI